MLRTFILAFAFLGSAALADSWAPPSKQTYKSADGLARLIVIPRDLDSALAYFEDKVAGREPAGRPHGSKATSARAILETRDASGRWITSWTKPLVNEVAPVDVLVANDGERVVTFDNWHSMGYGDSAIVIYDPHGTVIRSLALSDFFPNWYVAAQPHSVSSIHWRGRARLSADGSAVVVPVTLPRNDEGAPGSDGPTLDLSIRLSDAAPIGLASPEWKSALVRAAETAREMCRSERANTAKWNSPISAPTVWSEPDWHEYLREIYYRTFGVGTEELPTSAGTTVLRPASEADFKASEQWLKDALTEKAVFEHDGRAIGSPDYQRLTEEIEVIARDLRPNQLRGVDLIVVVDKSHTERVRAALSRSGAAVTIVDPLQTFPQRPERMQSAEPSALTVCQIPAAGL